MPQFTTVLKSVPTEASVVGNRQKSEKVEPRQVLRDWAKVEDNETTAQAIIDRLEEAGRDTEYIAQVLAVVGLYETGESWAASAQAAGLTEARTPKAGADSARIRYMEAFAIEAEKSSAATKAGRVRRQAFKAATSPDEPEQEESTETPEVTEDAA